MHNKRSGGGLFTGVIAEYRRPRIIGSKELSRRTGIPVRDLGEFANRFKLPYSWTPGGGIFIRSGDFSGWANAARQAR